MNTGIISSRYAKALLRYAQETGGGERVARQARELLANPTMDSIKLEPELERFVALLVRNGRIEDVRLMLRTYVALYYRSKGIELAHLTSTIPSPELETRIRTLLEKQFGCEVLLESSVDPALLGGFVVEIGDYLLDASVRNQIEAIRRQFVIQNNRIV